MLEKNGQIILTDQEKREVAAGILPERIKIQWDITLEELKQMMAQENSHAQDDV